MALNAVQDELDHQIYEERRAYEASPQAEAELDDYKKAVQFLVVGGFITQSKFDEALSLARTFAKKS